MSYNKIDRTKIDYIANFEARKGEPIASVKSNYQIEQEAKQKAFEIQQNLQKLAKYKTKNHINKDGQYHL